jgi:hypothetical protein
MSLSTISLPARRPGDRPRIRALSRRMLVIHADLGAPDGRRA